MEPLIEVVIPLGPMSPRLNAPVNDLLEFGLKNIKEQSIPVKLTCAVDNDLAPEKLEIVKKYADKIKVFGQYSYFAKGGIWKKIWMCWKESTCKYVGWQGYDDYNSLNRFKEQLEILEQTNSHACLCSTFIDNKLIDGTMRQSHNGFIDFRKTVGNHVPMGAYLLDRSYILNSGLGNYQEIWTAYFEGLLNLYILKKGKPCSTSKAIFYYRNQPAMVSLMGGQDKEFCELARKEVNYPWEQIFIDFNNTNYFSLSEELNKKEDLGIEIGKLAWKGN